MTEIDYDAREEAAQRMTQQAGEREVQPSDYGFCAYGDAPGAIGGGMPWFYWFESKDAMVAALRDHALFLNPPRSDIDLAATQAEVVSLIARCGDMESLRGDLNKCLVNASQFEWMGTFKELCESDTAFAKEVRSNFRDDTDRGEDSNPVKLDEVPAFIEMIGRYGI